MSLADATRSRVRKGPPCGVCKALEELDPTEAAALQALLEDDEWRYTQIADALHAEAVKGELPAWVGEIASFTIGTHVRGGCSARKRLR